MKQNTRTLVLNAFAALAIQPVLSHSAIITYSSANSAFDEFTIVTNADTGGGLTPLASGSTIRVGTISNLFNLLTEAGDYLALDAAFNEFELLNSVGDIDLDEAPDSDGSGGLVEGGFRTGQNDIDGFDATESGTLTPYDTNGDTTGDPVMFMLLQDSETNPTQYALVTSSNWAFPGDTSGSESLTMSIHDELEAGTLQVFHGSTQVGTGSNPNVLSLAAVPEPSSSLLIGVAGILLLRPRRN